MSDTNETLKQMILERRASVSKATEQNGVKSISQLTGRKSVKLPSGSSVTREKSTSKKQVQTFKEYMDGREKKEEQGANDEPIPETRAQVPINN
ncbi:hypothetical protein HDV01_004256 [Terramyces sp. JEL0728]|nr:hypothetical protein HDV01_004256 [Terramyces sp. JEL0728]